MSIVVSPESAYAQELRKWEMRPTLQVPNPLTFGEGGRMGMPFQEFPKAMYLAGRNDKGGIIFADYQEAADETKERNMRSRGFGHGQQEALDLLHERDNLLAVAAAERAYADRKMSPEAQEEAKIADESTGKHVGSVPETPILHRQKKA